MAAPPPPLLAAALAVVGGPRERRRSNGGAGAVAQSYHTSGVARGQDQEHREGPQAAAPVAAAGTQPQPHQPAPAQKKPPPKPPSRAVLAVGRVARQRWVTVAGVVGLGVGGIMAADWAAESLVNWWQGKRDGEDDF